MTSRYGAMGTADPNPRQDPVMNLEQPQGMRMVGPVRAVQAFPSGLTLTSLNIGVATGCANAVFTVTGGVHIADVLGVGACPGAGLPTGIYASGVVVIGSDVFGGTDALRVHGNVDFTGLGTGGGLVISGGLAGSTPPSSLVDISGSSGSGNTVRGLHISGITTFVTASSVYGADISMVHTFAGSTLAEMAQLILRSPTFGAGSLATDNYGLRIESITGGTNNYAIRTGLGLVSFGGNVITSGSLTATNGVTVGTGTLLFSNTPLTNGAAAALGTLTNAPAAGNPTKWVPINDNGTTRYVPAW